MLQQPNELLQSTDPCSEGAHSMNPHCHKVAPFDSAARKPGVGVTIGAQLHLQQALATPANQGNNPQQTERGGYNEGTAEDNVQNRMVETSELTI